MTRIAAILGGGDWWDATVSHLVLPAPLNVDEAKKRYNEWYHRWYNGGHDPLLWMSFPDYLIKHEGCQPAGSAVEVYES